MEKRPFISIVMPVYNAENDVSRMIESVQAQTLEEWELLVVDDCSTDKTCEKVEHYCNNDCRIKLIRQKENAGPGNAKNQGIKNAKGEYLTFTDADDWIEKEALAYIKEHVDFDTEIIICGLYRDIYNEEGKMLECNKVSIPIAKMTSKKDVINWVPLLDQQRLFAYAWNKVYKKQIIDDYSVTFSDKRFGEDYDFNIAFFGHVSKGIILGEAFYHYIKKNTESLTEKYLPNYYEINHDRFLKMKKLLNDNDCYTTERCQMVMTSYVRHLLMAVARLYDRRGNVGSKFRRKKVKEILRGNLTKEAIKYSKATTLSGKVCNGILKTRSVCLILIFGKTLWWIQNDAKGLYEKIKR